MKNPSVIDMLQKIKEVILLFLIGYIIAPKSLEQAGFWTQSNSCTYDEPILLNFVGISGHTMALACQIKRESAQGIST